MLKNASSSRGQSSALIVGALIVWSVVLAPTASSGADVLNPIITTVAGDGTAGVSGDGGLATAARVNNPTGAAVDSAGNVYIADQNNHRIRKIAAGSGLMSTFAGTGTAGFLGDGGAATAARLNAPTGVAVDAADNVHRGQKQPTDP